METQKWIFVTGAPRSGTTFVGKILSLPLEVDYLHEPFNPHCGLRGIDRLYLYVSPSSFSSLHYYKQIIDCIFRHDFSLKTGYFKDDPLWRKTVKRIIGPRSAWSLRLVKLNPFHKAMVIKDPIGCLLTEYLVEHYNVKPVIMVQHPVAVVASMMRLGWKMDLDPIREQRELVEDYFSDEIAFLYAPRNDPVEKAAALWRALNKVLLDQASRHQGWQVILHQNLSRDPVENFRGLYKALDLQWSPRIEAKVIKLTDRQNPVAARKGQVHDFKRNSAELFNHSLKMLSRQQRRKVYEITRDVALQVFTEESFGLDDER